MAQQPKVIEIKSEAEFRAIQKKHSQHLIITTFYTDTCPACRAFKPSFFAVAEELASDTIIFIRINAGRFPNIAQQYKIFGVPTTIWFKGQKILLTRTGGFPKPQFRRIVNDIMKKEFNKKTFGFDDSELMYM